MKVTKIISAALALCMSAAIFTGCGDGDDGGSGGHNTPEAAAFAILDGANSGNAIELLNASMPAEFTSALKSKDPSEYDDFLDDAQDVIDELKHYYGDNYVMTGEITRKKPLSGDDLDDWNSDIKDFCKHCSLKVHSVSEGYEIEFDYTVNGGGTSRTRSGELEVLNIDGIGWYALVYDY